MLLVSYILFIAPIPERRYWVMQVVNAVSVIVFICVLITNAVFYNKDLIVDK